MSVSRDRWASLTWQAADPDALVEDLAQRLHLSAVRVGGTAWQFDLGGEALNVVPWRREGPADQPTIDGRLVFEPIEGGGVLPALVDDAPLVLAGVAWATVELDRAEEELDPWLSPLDTGLGDGDAPPDPHLGAIVRRRRSAALPGGALLLAEPSTEGRLAASLARDSEGPCALYLRPSLGLSAWVQAARSRGVKVSARRPGPLGQAVRLPGRAFAGPHLIVVEPPNAQPRPSTIAP